MKHYVSRHSFFDQGFTIVELLIVVVVIAILASITVVAYNGITPRANDSAVQSDLENMGKRLMFNNTELTNYPINETGLSTQGLRVAKASYGSPLIDAGMKYNVLYCSTATSYSPSSFAIVAASTSGNVYQFSSTKGGVQSYPKTSWTGGWGTICPDVLGVAAGNSNAGVWLYENSIWKNWL